MQDKLVDTYPIYHNIENMISILCYHLLLLNWINVYDNNILYSDYMQNIAAIDWLLTSKFNWTFDFLVESWKALKPCHSKWGCLQVGSNIVGDTEPQYNIVELLSMNFNDKSVHEKLRNALIKVLNQY